MTTDPAILRRLRAPMTPAEWARALVPPGVSGAEDRWNRPRAYVDDDEKYGDEAHLRRDR